MAVSSAVGCVADRRSEDATGGDPIGGDHAEPASLDAFADGEWSLHVDRTWDGASAKVTAPTDALSEADYHPTAEPTVHLVVVQKDGAFVSVGASPIHGSRSAASPTAIEFELSDGTFAGGRFVVRPGGKTLEAELTLFGSGRPIVESHRGELIRND